MGSYAGLTKPESVFFIKNFEGQDTATKDLSLTNKGDIAQNCRFNVEVGSVTKRSTIAYYNVSADPDPIQSIYRYYTTTGSQYLLQINGNNLRVGNDSNGTFSTIHTFSSSSGYRFSAVTYNDLCVVSTGQDNMIQTDGVVAWELGSCKAALVADAGGSVTAGAHYYAVTFTVSGSDVINGALSNTVTADASHTKVALSNIPLGPTGTTARKIYRTAAGGSTLKLLTTLADNYTTTYTDNTADGSLGATMGAVNNDMPKGALLHLEQERLFVTRDPNWPNTIYYSEQYLPHYIPTGSTDLSTMAASDAYDIIGGGDNDEITGIANYLGVTHIFKQNSIRPYYVSGTPDTWSLGNIVSTQGCPSPYSIVTTPYGIVYEGWDYFYVYNGNFSLPYITEFSIKNNILAARLPLTCAIYHQGMYIAAYTDANLGHQYHDRVLIYDMVNKQMSIDKGGPRTTGGYVNINCFASAMGGTDEGQLFAGDSIAGHVYKYDRRPDVVNYRTKTDFDTGTYGGSSVIGSETNPVLTRETIDAMEYAEDEDARGAWVTSQTTASKKVPPDLGTGVDGVKTVSSNETLSSGVYNYVSLTVDSGKTLTVPGDAIIKCLGTAAINGNMTISGTGIACLYAQTITIGSTGVLNGTAHFRANTINNSGTIEQLLGSCPSASYDRYQGGGNLSDSRSTSANFSASTTVAKIVYSLYAYGYTDGYSSAPNSSGSASLELLQNGSWTTIYSASDSGGGSGHGVTLSGTGTGAWANATAIRANVASSASADHDVRVIGGISSAQAYNMPICDYINSSGFVPSSTDTADFVNLLECFSESNVYYQGAYSLKAVCPPGADTLNQYFTRTVSAMNLSAPTHDTILMDVYALRSGTNFQFGMGESSGTDNLVNVPVTSSNAWETVALDFSSVPDANKDAITKFAIKFTNTDSGNVVYIDNIRPALASAAWTSPVLHITADQLGNMYWNEYLGLHGDVNIYTRNASTDALCQAASWSTGLTNPAGSPIVSTGGSTDPNDLKYFQFKIEMASTDTPNYAEFPYLYYANSCVVKFDYYKVQTNAETSVELIYRTGSRNFDLPLQDKIFRKIISVHEKPDTGPAGYFNLSYDIDDGDGTSYAFSNIDLELYPHRFESFFPDTAFGRAIRFQWYKNDIYDFKIKQLGVVMTSEPVI